MKQTKRLNAIVVAMMAISHNRVDYPAGATFEAPEDDVVFLKQAKYVREPTADELAAYRASLAPKPITTIPDFGTANDNELPQHTTATDEPDTAETKPETVEPESVEAVEPKAVEAVQPETIEPELVENETVEPEPEVTKPEPVEPASVPNPYDGWLKSDLNAELDKRGIERDVTRNDELEALLIADDAQQAQAAE